MTLTTVLNKLKSQPFTSFLNHDVYLNALTAFGILSLSALAVWILGPHIAWNNNIPLASTEKRLYVIVLMYLIWLLKFLILDLDAPITSFQNNLAAQKKVLVLHATFRNALLFLKRSITTKQGTKIKLNRLPWYLVIGPSKAGKTALLTNAGVHYVLHKHSLTQPNQAFNPTENCEWWVTREFCMVDVPGKYLAATQPNKFYTVAWSLFLRLLKRHRGKHGLGGIVLALPITYFLGDKKQSVLQNTLARLHEIRRYFPDHLPCRIVLTKCDLIPGFSEFFSESSQDEISQAWGISLHETGITVRQSETFIERFNELIKKINQQLLWRLHQERNPFARPYIKDFPLQLEKIKSSMAAFLKSLGSMDLPVSIQSIHLTSALQNKAEPITNVIEHGTSEQRTLQILNEPSAFSRPHFIKQFIAHGLNSQPLHYSPTKARLYSYGVYSFAIIATLGSAAWFSSDFKKGVQQTQSLQQYFAVYQKAMAQTHNQEQHLILTNELLNTLQPPPSAAGWHLNLQNILSFYSKKAELNSTEVYQQALQRLLVPELGAYFTDYLKIPVNQNADNVYAVLKAYLMLNDPNHFQPGYILETAQTVLPKSFNEQQSQQLLDHLRAALNIQTQLSLDGDLIQQTRKYLVSMQSVQLSYIILKNINENNLEQVINLGTPDNTDAVFTTKQLVNQLPTMYTGSEFNNILSQETLVAAQEALLGNWVLGQNTSPIQQNIYNTLIQEVRTLYVNNYVDAWETLLANIRVVSPHSLVETDQLIVRLISNDSPLIGLLRVIHDNTYFPAIVDASPKLQNIGSLIETDNQNTNLLYQVFAGLQNLHSYLQVVITSSDPSQAAFNLLSKRLHHEPDAITQLRIIADKSPEPLKSWLNVIDDDAWHFLMREAGSYLNTAWQQQIIQPYQSYIQNRYPFNLASNQEVDINHFVSFFGNPGSVVSFYNDYISQLIDINKGQWHWKKMDNKPLPFSNDTLRQIQLAMHIHRVFFPEDNDVLRIAFTLKPYDFGKNIKSVAFKIADQAFLDGNSTDTNAHDITWPTSAKANAAMQLTMTDNQTITHRYNGDWGWYKMINQSFDSVISKEQLLINFSMNENQAKYILAINGKHNPFLSLNLQHFYFPTQFTVS